MLLSPSGLFLLLVLKRDVNSVLVAGTFYAVDIIFLTRPYLFIFLWVTGPQPLCPLGKLNNPALSFAHVFFG